MSSFLGLELLTVAIKFLENLCTPDGNLYPTNRSLPECQFSRITDPSHQGGVYIKRIKIPVVLTDASDHARSKIQVVYYRKHLANTLRNYLPSNTPPATPASITQQPLYIALL
jgi:hypothetical protein